VRSLRKIWRLLQTSLLFAILCNAAPAQTFPSKPIRLVVPFPPGGATDTVARPLAQLLAEDMKQQIIIDNRGGAGGTIGADNVAKSPADGYSLLMATVGTHAINPTLYKKLPYDAVGDFTPIDLVAAAPVTVLVNPAQTIASVRELIERARRAPGTLNYGSAGNGTPGHLTAEMFKSAAQVDLRHVPYKGGAPAIVDLLGGQIELMFEPLPSVMAHIQSGRLRILAVSSGRRSSALPSVPTLAESGLTGFEATAWWGVFAPAHVPETIANQLNAAAERVVRSAPFHERLEALGVQAMGGTRAQFAQFQKREIEKWGNAVRASGATLD
jgi:tripartite-type tricarboxylate transporter receptor subunit TctC